jgi:hypothetical protein
MASHSEWDSALCMRVRGISLGTITQSHTHSDNHTIAHCAAQLTAYDALHASSYTYTSVPPRCSVLYLLVLVLALVLLVVVSGCSGRETVVVVIRIRQQQKTRRVCVWLVVVSIHCSHSVHTIH